MLDYNIRKGNQLRNIENVKNFVVVKNRFQFVNLEGYIKFIFVYLTYLKNNAKSERIIFYICEYEKRILSFLSKKATYKEDEDVSLYQKRVSKLYNETIILDKIEPTYEVDGNLEFYLNNDDSKDWIYVYVEEETCSKKDLEMVFDEAWLKQINGFNFDNNSKIGKRFINNNNYHVDAINSLKILVNEINRIRICLKKEILEWYDEEDLQRGLNYADCVIQRIEHIQT